MNRYKVLITVAPLWTYVDAEDEEDAIDKAYDSNDWEGNDSYGTEEYEVVLVEENIREK